MDIKEGKFLNVPNTVVVHPIVLLSVVDHYNRVAKDTKKRVVGILLGESNKGTIDASSSYAVPFEEDAKDPKIWFLDHVYHENMYQMYKKINAKEKVIGWYSTGPKIRKADIAINELLRRYTPNPIYVICKVQAQEESLGIPTEAYCAVEEVNQDGQIVKNFMHIPSSIGASEAEQVGVEHLLREVKDVSIGTLSHQISDKTMGLRALINKLSEIRDYLGKVVNGKYPVNPQIVYNLQEIFNYLPNLKVEELVKSFSVKNNDFMLTNYICSIIRSVIALHNLVNNKITNKEIEKANKKDLEKGLKEPKVVNAPELFENDDSNQPNSSKK